jgi:hypothetical protein
MTASDLEELYIEARDLERALMLAYDQATARAITASTRPGRAAERRSLALLARASRISMLIDMAYERRRRRYLAWRKALKARRNPIDVSYVGGEYHW